MVSRKPKNPYKNGMGPLNKLEKKVAKITSMLGRTSVKKTKKKKKNSSNVGFGPVASIATAPVAIGNSIQGSKPRAKSLGLDSTRVTGRDLAFTASATGTSANWCLVGAVPLTPTAFNNSILRGYCQIYNKFKIRKWCVHYITSSSTSTNGDVLIYYNKERTSPFPNFASTSFLNFALSDPGAVLGPQWTNHSTCAYLRSDSVFDMNTGNGADIDQQADGEICLYSKTSSSESPGYFIVDYEIDFFETGVNPRSGLLPNPLIMYQPIQLTLTAATYTANSTVIDFDLGTTWIGGTTITKPNLLIGDVYKIVLDVGNSNAAAWTVTSGTAYTAANLLASAAYGGDQDFTATTGLTLYMRLGNNSHFVLYDTIDEAATSSGTMQSGSSSVAVAYGDNSHNPNAGVWLYGMCSYVMSSMAQNLQQQ